MAKKNFKRLARLIEAAEDEADKAEKKEEETNEIVPFQGLDLRYARCFGRNGPKDQTWVDLAEQAEDMGWSMIDQKQLEKNMTIDVDKSYFSIAEFKLVNIEDDMAYDVKFDNKNALWQVKIADSPKAEMSSEERADFFKSELFKKLAMQTYRHITKAKDIFFQIVDGHMKEGNLLLVDAIKLRAILDMIDSKYFLDNLRNGKYFNF